MYCHIALPIVFVLLISRFRSRFCSNGTRNGNNRTMIGGGGNLNKPEEETAAATGTPCGDEGEEGSDYKIRAGRRSEFVLILNS